MYKPSNRRWLFQGMGGGLSHPHYTEIYFDFPVDMPKK
jgi:hypothetical protein